MCVGLIEDFSRLGISSNKSFIDDKDFFTRFFKENIQTIRHCSKNLEFQKEANFDVSFGDRRVE